MKVSAHHYVNFNQTPSSSQNLEATLHMIKGIAQYTNGNQQGNILSRLGVNASAQEFLGWAIIQA